MKEKIKNFFKKIGDKVSARLEKSPTYKKFLQQRDELAEKIRVKLLAFFSYIGPVWTFLFVKNSEPGKSNDNKNGFSQVLHNCSETYQLAMINKELS